MRGPTTRLLNFQIDCFKFVIMYCKSVDMNAVVAPYHFSIRSIVFFLLLLFMKIQ